MLQEIERSVEWFLGLNADELEIWHMAARAVVVYNASLVMVRAGDKRFFRAATDYWNSHCYPYQWRRVFL